MKSQSLAGSVLALGMFFAPAFAADDEVLAGMALCKESWAESKNDPDKLKPFAEDFRARFTQHEHDAYFVPKGNVSVLGLRVSQAYPESVGMGVGFSLTVDATFDGARKEVERALGKKLQKCESSEGMKNCELEIARQRTVMLMGEDKPGSRRTLIGCYYFYEK